jgi:hypothetical protein
MESEWIGVGYQEPVQYVWTLDEAGPGGTVCACLYPVVDYS